MSDQLERVARALCRYNLRITFPANSAEWIESRVEIEWPMHKQKAEDAIAALRPELADARFQREIVQQCFMLLEIACSGDERRVKFDALKAQYEGAARQEGK
jgi:hypothetical protein